MTAWLVHFAACALSCVLFEMQNISFWSLCMRRNPNFKSWLLILDLLPPLFLHFSCLSFFSFQEPIKASHGGQRSSIFSMLNPCFMKSFLLPSEAELQGSKESLLRTAAVTIKKAAWKYHHWQRIGFIWRWEQWRNRKPWKTRSGTGTTWKGG